MRSTVCTRKAMNILLKFVTIKMSFGFFSRLSPRYLGRSTTVSTASRGLKMPSTAAWAWGMGFTGAEIMISRTLATLMPYRLPPMVNFMISISLVPDSSRISCLLSSLIPMHSLSSCAYQIISSARP